ncbi:uncharacterized protein N0V89_006551 [Didymosphaeria variabile]|uniref:Uncharacterized protein n=1 Tax=Didymosphaeria variabile TaxID=1932322 RepID=A0A9W8XI06_9PLEO|nr:uncharacterized protein N0V89_006551 [Didymosphaeria variabile]KAJ4351212.1 hypothetical protein N0V89_006551 [Didymosphaeria variabile]
MKSAEMNAGLIVANLPACRPLLDSFISRIASSRGLSRDRSHGAPISGSGGKTMDRYLELEEQANAGLETRIYGKRDGDSGSDFDIDDADSESQKGIVGRRKKSNGGLRVQVTKDISVTSSTQQV